MLFAAASLLRLLSTSYLRSRMQSCQNPKNNGAVDEACTGPSWNGVGAGLLHISLRKLSLKGWKAQLRHTESVG
ncbi:hypothetical protein BZA05DRAFT_408284 [Tricharina praecox]|uniref:uncharacterized protein n=1 Tax=Tricharina praecox TaxID=43433 RepID=UPI00221E8002|nr:uncharacterized protein BZA05DRAFT_408284 [Tricharina praecox]KAI5845370.1 hypothetical protein BZA05DRAFT_408284 [Tricharina praecox]